MALRGAVFVLPTVLTGQLGPVAAYMSTAGWATAAERVLGAAWVVGPTGLVRPDELRSRGSSPRLSSADARSWARRIPAPVKTAIKDLRQWRRARAFTVDTGGPWSGSDVAFVWQRHDLFHDAGLELAAALDVPSVLFVPAPLVWEAKQWRVARRGWASALERLGEAPALRRADVVACGSDDVVGQVLRLGTRPDRVVVTPTGVDLDMFSRDGDRGAVREELGLQDRFVVGWVGSFRPFHALELAIEAAAEVSKCALLLIGDGPERPAIEEHARRLGVDAVFTGTIAHIDLPRYLSAMDVGLVLAANDGAYHYSPLKLAEYLAAGLPVVVPRVAQLGDRLTDRVDAVFVRRGNAGDLVEALRWLRDDDEARRRIGVAARHAAVERWSWDDAVRRVVAALP